MAKVYNANEVTLSIGGKTIDAGFASGEFISIEESAPRITKAVGTDGEITISRHMDRTGTVKVKLMQTSDGNDVLDNMAKLNEDGPGLPGVKTLYIRDRNGRAIHESDACWVEGAPTVSYDQGATAREWTLGTGTLKNRVKGSASV
jgi:hypothetical protein